MIEPRWLSVEEVLQLHAVQIATFGGAPGVRDYGLLDAAMMRPRQRFYYGDIQDVPEIATAYTVALSANHPFIDGNKRVAFHSMLVFLRLHGASLEAPPIEATQNILALAGGQYSESELLAWVRMRTTV